MKEHTENRESSSGKKKRASPQCTESFRGYGRCYEQTRERRRSLVAGIFPKHDANRVQYLTIHESELRVIAGISALWAEFRLESGGDGYGLWTHGGRLVILLVTGPGPKAIHKPAHFTQDIDFFHRTSGLIALKLGIQWTKTYHSHHFMTMQGPSSYDVGQVQNVATRTNFARWCEIVTTCERACAINRVRGMHRHNSLKTRNSLRIRVCAFLYTNPQRGEKVQIPLRVLPGMSPFRLKALADKTLSPRDIGEYASDFPMEQIIYEAFDFEEYYSAQATGIPRGLVEQCMELPERVRSDLVFRVEQGIVVVTLPLPDGKAVDIGYREKTPHQIHSMKFTGSDGLSDIGVFEAFRPEKNIPLNDVYGMLVSRINRRKNRNVDTRTM